MHHQSVKAHLHDSFNVSDWVTRTLRNTLDEFTARLQSGLAVLASVRSTAPFVGLFGTVWGIYSNRDSKCRFLNGLKVVCESGRE